MSHDVPFGKSARDTCRTLYEIADPFLRFWFRFVEPNRSQLERGNAAIVAGRVEAAFPAHLGSIWEDLARAATPHLSRFGQAYEPASRWWGSTPTGPVELDLVAMRADRGALLIGEAKLSVAPSEVDRLIWDLEFWLVHAGEASEAMIGKTRVRFLPHEALPEAAAALQPATADVIPLP